MSPAPLISIVMPLFNDEEALVAALDSCLQQSLDRIEVICVDDASTDRTADILASYRARDSRVRVVRRDSNGTAFQARRIGVLAARADYILFVDGDDELSPNAARIALAAARSSKADLVGFGVTVVEPDGRTGSAYEERLQPRHRHLDGEDVLAGLFPVGSPAQGQLWRFLFRTTVLREAYALVPPDLALRRINDLPLMFLVAALARSYISVPDRLYRYHFGRGGSGQRVDSPERAEFYASAIDSISSISGAVAAISKSHPDSTLLEESYRSVRLSIIGYVCKYFIDHADSDGLSDAFDHIDRRVSPRDLFRAAAIFYPAILPTLASRGESRAVNYDDVQSVALVTGRLSTGGISGVILTQARLLRDAGYRVVIIAKTAGSDLAVTDIDVAYMSARGSRSRLAEWARLLVERDVDVVIDHHVLYSRDWPDLALMARTAAIPTIGWLHNFAARPILDQNYELWSLLTAELPRLDRVIVLSPTDVAFWKLRGVERTAYLPNPPSPLLLRAGNEPTIKSPPKRRIDLVWWGRLEQSTKQPRDLIEVADALRTLDVDFRLTIIGPDWHDLTARQLNEEARRRRLDDRVQAIGPRSGDELVSAIDNAHMLVGTSVIEGYPLTLVEAQARGLPVVMYRLPWLAMARDNRGLVTVAQGDFHALARQIAEIASDPERYALLSRGAHEAAHRAQDHDFTGLYTMLVSGHLPREHSPEPTVGDAGTLLDLTLFFAERASRSSARRPARQVRDREDYALRQRMWDIAAPTGRRLLHLAPSLRRIAHRAKRRLLGV